MSEQAGWQRARLLPELGWAGGMRGGDLIWVRGAPNEAGQYVYANTRGMRCPHGVLPASACDESTPRDGVFARALELLPEFSADDPGDATS